MTQMYRVPVRVLQDARMGEDMPFATHGGLAVRHTFPLDGEYVFKLLLKRDDGRTIVGIEEDEHQIELRVDHALLKLFRSAAKSRGSIRGR